MKIFDSLLRSQSKLTPKELLELDPKIRTEFESLQAQIAKGSFSELLKKAVDVNFDSQFLTEFLQRRKLQDFSVSKPDFNLFEIKFSNATDLNLAQKVFRQNALIFSESLDKEELNRLKNCIFIANSNLQKNFNIKKNEEEYYFSVSKEVVEKVTKSSQNYKCFDPASISIITEEGFDFDVYSKLFLVIKNTDLEKRIIENINAFSFKSDIQDQDHPKNKFSISIFTGEKAKINLQEFTKKNLGKKIFISDGDVFLLNPEVSTVIDDGKILFTGDLFDLKWKLFFRTVQFQVFKNNITIQ